MGFAIFGIVLVLIFLSLKPLAKWWVKNITPTIKGR